MLDDPADVDTNLVRELAYEEELVGVDLSEELLVEKVVHLYPRLRYVASVRETTTYEEVTEGFKIASYARIGSILGIISAMEHRRGNPLITAVVTSASGDVASEGFFVLLEVLGCERPETPEEKRECWKSHLEDVYDVWATRGRLGS